MAGRRLEEWDARALTPSGSDLVVGPQGDQEAGVAVPAEQDPKVVVDAECPVVAEVTLELVRPQERIEWIGREPAERRPQQLVSRRPELASSAQEPG